MKILHKMLAAPAVAIGLMLVVAGVAAYGMHRERAALHEFSTVHLQGLRATGDVRYELAAVRSDVYRLFTVMSNFDEARVKVERAALRKRLDDAGALLEGLRAAGAAAGAADEAGRLADAAAAAIGQYAKKADDAIDMGSVDVNTGVASMMSADEQYKATLEQVAAAARYADDRAQQTMAATEALADRSLVVMAVVVALAVAAAFAVALRFARRTSRELGATARSAGALAQGDLTATFCVSSRDELGQLVEALETMRAAFMRVLADIRAASDSVSHASREIDEGNRNLGTRTEQQASSLQETAASMEQLSTTVRHNADNARQANELAVAASGVAGKGGDAVARVVATMNAISDQSRKIAEIINVIDGIAFQTNILALNAAVEAARAGDSGRGFAVVAGEVRNLAQRSTQAAREIKALIGASVEKVGAGAREVAEAGSTMTDIVDRVKRVSELIGEISAATLEQSSGIGQVKLAVSQIDEMTQQNAGLV
ncbi:MAG TPA: methyl-accepting chemotaxis protein, partial [Burkholderiaceae bacterium]